MRILVSGGAGFIGGNVVKEFRRALDAERAGRAFGFRATADLEKGQRETIEWHEETRSR